MLPRPITALLVLITALLLPLALVSSWVATTVGETDEYVDTVAPLAEETVLVDAAHREIESRVLSQLGPAATRPQVTEGVDRALTRVLEGPEFPPAWEGGNRILHRQVRRILDSDDTRRNSQWVRVDLAPLVDDVTKALRNEGVQIPSGLADRDLTVKALRTSDVERARGYYDLIQKAGSWLPLAWLVAIVLTLLTARRRLAALGHLAVASLITLALLAGVLLVARPGVAGDADGTVPAVLWSTLTRGLWTSVGVAAMVAAIVLAVRMALGLVPRKS
ncbi:MAG: hypothetical protein L0H93_05620 [Nocardioides sp.]|nr:hypothetical protein [Nocardioides sp.]